MSNSFVGISRLVLAVLAVVLTSCGKQSSAPDGRTTGLQLINVVNLGLAYANSSINVSSFRQQSIVLLQDRKYAVAYFDQFGEARIDIVSSTGSLENSIWIEPQLATALLNDGHASINMGTSADGMLHIAYGAHATFPYLLSLKQSVLSELTAPTRYSSNVWPLRITYPQFYEIDGITQLWFRLDPNREIHRSEFVETDATFATNSEGIILPGSTFGVYANQLALNGQRLFLSWLYRLDTTDQIVRNTGIFSVSSSDSGRTWRSSAGGILGTPIPHGAAEQVLCAPSSRQPLNQTSSFSSSNGTTYLTYYQKDDLGIHQIYLAQIDNAGNLQSSEVVSVSTAKFDLDGRGTLVLPLSRPQVIASDNTVYVLYRQNQKFIISSRALNDEQAWNHQVIPTRDLGAWEPTLDIESWHKDRRVLVYVQPARQGALDTGVPGQPEQAQIYFFLEQ